MVEHGHPDRDSGRDLVEDRGLEIAADAADAAQSAVLDQVSAGVAVRMSVLYHLLAGEGSAQ